MSIRLFHRGARLVVHAGSQEGERVWVAFHRAPPVWAELFAPALLLVGFSCERDGGANGVRFGDGGSIHWTRGAMWTTIRLRLPRCSEKKAALLAGGLLKVARYG
jgi:hypothetical protein